MLQKDKKRKGYKLEKKIYFWIEDKEGKSGYIFWKNFMNVLFPNVILESKGNNSKLIQAVQKLEDEENEFIIAFDHSFDNPEVIRELRNLRASIHERKNVHELNIICFEYILLEFEKLITWIYAPEDEFIEKRRNVICAREKLINAVKQKSVYKSLQEIKDYLDTPEKYNIEQLSAKMLFDLTRNTGFEVTKGEIGECWIRDCCDWENRQEDDICGLDMQRLWIKEKMLQIYKYSSLKDKLKECGLEVSF